MVILKPSSEWIQALTAIAIMIGIIGVLLHTMKSIKKDDSEDN
jgi:hypothetical protein